MLDSESNTTDQNDSESVDFQNLNLFFPHWSKEKLLELFQLNSCSLEQTIQTVLAIEEASKENAATEGTQNAAPSNDAQSYRGKRVTLPDDFLRVFSAVSSSLFHLILT
jgi:hypothetical protein